MNEKMQPIIRRKQVDEAELGAYAKLVTRSSILKAIQLVKEGQVYDLGLERFHGMPLPGMHPPLEILTYRSIQGMKNQGDQEWITGEANSENFGFTSDLVITCLHTGTHIDTLSHANAGPEHTWYGGYSANKYVGDYGALKSDASTLASIVLRGVLIDVASHLGVDALAAGTAITEEILRATVTAENIEIQEGDVVLIRTGYMSQWPDRDKLAEHSGSGISLDAAKWLASKNILAVGTDTEAVEQFPGSCTTNPHPVHTFLLVKNGIFMIECLDLEALSRDKHYEFLFIALPIKFKGGTAGLMDPVAIL
jgi:kynurenine formamidase